MRRMLDPQITKPVWCQVLSKDGYADALSSVNTLQKSFKHGHRAQAYTATSAGQMQTLLKVCV